MGDYTIGDQQPVTIVAELGVNHLGDYGRMKEMIAAAVENGADMLKFQTYTADKRYDPVNNPKGRMFIKWLKEWEFTRDQEAELWEYAQSLGATVFTSAFDPESADFAESLGTVGYKIAAFELVNNKLLRHVASKGKPVVFTRGMATQEEVDNAVRIITENGAEPVILHTTSSYPARRMDTNLWTIHALRERYDWPVGHSDHTHGTSVPPLAVAAGANMIEKHFTVNQKLRESDNFFSLTPNQLKEMVFKVRQTERVMGSEVVKCEAEEYMYDFRRHTD